MSSFIPLLDDWLKALVGTPGLTAIKDVEEARTVPAAGCRESHSQHRCPIAK